MISFCSVQKVFTAIVLAFEPLSSSLHHQLMLYLTKSLLWSIVFSWHVFCSTAVKSRRTSSLTCAAQMCFSAQTPDQWGEFRETGAGDKKQLNERDRQEQEGMKDQIFRSPGGRRVSGVMTFVVHSRKRQTCGSHWEGRKKRKKETRLKK